jgi:hypothetical protein
MAQTSPGNLWDSRRHRRVRVHRIRGARSGGVGHLSAAWASAVAKHRSKNVLLYQRGGINFVVNAEPDGFAQAFRARAGPRLCHRLA